MILSTNLATVMCLNFYTSSAFQKLPVAFPSGMFAVFNPDMPVFFVGLFQHSSKFYFKILLHFYGGKPTFFINS